MNKNKLIKDLPIYINGFVVAYLFTQTRCNIIDCIMFGLAIVSFLWFGMNEKTKN
jgi:hypothetical protein